MTRARRPVHASLWLQEDTSPRQLALRSRFRHYPHFEAVLDEYVDLKIPPMVLVRWVPLAHISERIPVHSAEEAARERAFIRDVARRMKAGADIPPVLLRNGHIHDGRHRTLAAKMLGLQLVPVVDTDAYWHETPVEHAPPPAPAAPSTGYRWPHALAPRERNPREAAPPEIASLLPEIVRVAQAQYDAWQQDEEGFDEEYGAGGICHLIAEDMSSVLARKALACTTVSSMQEVHVYVVVKLPSGVWRVDIEPHVYETGAAYTWKKRPDVTFTEDDVTVERLSASPKDFADFVEDGWSETDDEDDGRAENPVAAAAAARPRARDVLLSDIDLYEKEWAAGERPGTTMGWLLSIANEAGVAMDFLRITHSLPERVARDVSNHTFDAMRQQVVDASTSRIAHYMTRRHRIITAE